MQLNLNHAPEYKTFHECAMSQINEISFELSIAVLYGSGQKHTPYLLANFSNDVFIWARIWILSVPNRWLGQKHPSQHRITSLKAMTQNHDNTSHAVKAATVTGMRRQRSLKSLLWGFFKGRQPAVEGIFWDTPRLICILFLTRYWIERKFTFHF